MIKRTLLALSACIALPASASWTLDEDASSLNFMSTKNAQITEIHSFDSLNGTLSDSGKLKVTVPLSSVNTNIDIRNGRMQEMLFETDKYPKASFSATLPDTVMSMKAGSAMTTKVDGELMIHGQTVPSSFDVMVTKVDADTLTATTTAPFLINADDFKLGAGVEALREVAGLDSITLTVPVTFSVTFTQ